MAKCGGLGELKQATEETQGLADQVREDAEKKANMKFVKFEAISFKSQVVAGVNYFIKVHVGDRTDGYVHLRVFQPLPQTGKPPEFVGIQLNKTLEDEITYF